MPKENAGRSMSLTSQESYSAVIIADLVAEVQEQPDKSPYNHRRDSKVVHRTNSARSDIFHRKGSQKHKKKEETNLGYDDGLQNPPAVVDVGTTETVTLGKANGTDITKGVILNAQLDHQLNSSDFFNGGGKAIELGSGTVQVTVQDVGGKDSKEAVMPGEFKDMSVLRRIAFAASFLPSIMFVVCFAVLLPCEKKVPCVEDMWTMTLNDTVVTSGLKFPDSIVFAYSRTGTDGILGINTTNGITLWDETLSSPPRFIDCANLITKDSQACLISDTSGAVHFYNAATGEQLLRWDPTDHVGGAPTPSLPVILPDCDGDGVAEVAVAVSPLRLKVLFKGFSVYFVEIPMLCDRMPERLGAWTTENGTELVFTCRNGTNENLVRVSQEKWCASVKKNKGKGEIVTLDSRTSGVLTNSSILPTKDGIIVWSEDDVTMIQLNGQRRWSVLSQGHHSKNRFLLYGKFHKTDSHVALFSSDILTNLQMSTLSSETGESVWNRTVVNAEISDISLIQGLEKDFILAVIRKVERDLANQAVTHISEVSTSIMNLLSEQEVEAKVPNVTSSNVLEEIVLMELNGDYTQSIDQRKMKFSEGEAFSSKVAVVPKHTKEAKDLKMIALRKPTESASELSSQLKRINVANWDITLSHSRECIAVS